MAIDAIPGHPLLRVIPQSSEVAAPSGRRLPDWDDFRVLVTVIRVGSFNRAAEVLGLTQPTVSRRIAALEQAMGVRMNARSTSGAELTLEGKRIFEELVTAHDALDRALSGATQSCKDVVTLLITDGLAAYWVTNFLPALYQKCPGLELRILTSNQFNAERHGQCDLSSHFLAPADPDAIAIRLGMLHFVPYAAPALHCALRHAGFHRRPRASQSLGFHALRGGSGLLGYEAAEWAAVADVPFHQFQRSPRRSGSSGLRHRPVADIWLRARRQMHSH